MCSAPGEQVCPYRVNCQVTGVPSVSMSLRLPNMLRFSSWMAEALELLENPAYAAPTDKRFVAWVKLQRIVEECGSALALDDPHGTNVSLADKRVQAMLGGCEKQLDAWRANNKEVINCMWTQQSYCLFARHLPRWMHLLLYSESAKSLQTFVLCRASPPGENQKGRARGTQTARDTGTECRKLS